MQARKNTKFFFKIFILTRPAACYSIKPHFQKSSSHYREHHIQATALMPVKKKFENKIKIFTLAGPGQRCLL
jgi:hypothetical protein